MSIFWNKSNKKEDIKISSTDSNQSNQTTSVAPKELPDLAIEKYPIESAYQTKAVEIKKAEEVKPIEPVPVSPVFEELKMEAPVKPVPLKPAPIPVTIETPKIAEELNPQAKRSENNNSSSELNQYSFRNLNNMSDYTPKGMSPEDLIDEIEAEEENTKRILKQSFFSLLKDRINKHGASEIPDEPKELFLKMKQYHEEIFEKEKALKEKSKLDNLLAEKIMELELLEEGWYLLRKELESKQLLLIEKEKLIDKKNIELKNLIGKSGGFDKKINKETIPADKWFILKDGRRIGSIEELKNTLKFTNDPLFYHHVTTERNDFSSWIRHVFNDANLADKMLLAKTKDELIRILENN